jgi:hypothetical protein
VTATLDRRAAVVADLEQTAAHAGLELQGRSPRRPCEHCCPLPIPLVDLGREHVERGLRVDGDSHRHSHRRKISHLSIDD